MFSLRRYFPRRSASCVAAALLIVPLIAETARATDRTWTGGTTNWNTASNWGGTVPGSADNAVFSGTFTNQPTLTANTGNTGGLWMTGAPGQNVTISGAFILNLVGNTINGTSGLGILIDNTNARTFTISSSVQLQGAQTWKNSSANLFTVSGSTLTNGFGLTLANTSTGGTTLSGVISGSGAVTINNTGTGVTTFSNTGSTYTGQLTVQSGTLSIGTANNASSNGELGNSANSVILGGSGATGTLEYTGATASSTKKFTMATGGTGAFQIDTAANTLTLSGVIDGNGGLSKTGAGGLTLSVANTYSGGTTISAGTVTLGNASALGTGGLTMNGGTLELLNGATHSLTNLSGSGGTIEINGNNNTATLSVGSDNTSTSYSGLLKGDNTVPVGNNNTKLSLTKVGTGTLTLSGANTYNGTTTIKAGGILIGVSNVGTASGALGRSTAPVLLGDITGSNNTSLLTNGAFTFANAITAQAGNTGIATIGGNTDSNSIFSGAITLNHDLNVSQVANTGANALSITGGMSSGTAGTKTVTFAGPGNISVGTTAISNGSGTVGVNVTGGKTTFNIANTYTGLTNITAGTLVEGVNDALGTGALTVNGSTAVFDLGANHTDSVGTVILDGGGSITGTGTSTLTSTATFDMRSGSVSAILGGGVALNKSTSGTVTLTGANTYTGGTNISAGSLSFANGSLGTTGTVAFTGNSTLQWNGTNTQDISSRLKINDGVIGTVDTNGNNVTFASALQLGPGSTGGLTKTGSGMLTLTANNSMTGTITVNGSGSILQVGNGGTTGSLGSGNVVDNATLAFNRSDNIAINNAISGSGILTQLGAGILSLGGNNSYLGGTNLNNGTLSLASANAIGTSGTISFNGGILQFTSSNTTDYSSRFSNAASQQYKIDTNAQNVTLASNLTSSGGSLTKLGADTLILSGANSYDAGTNINGGTLDLGSSGAIGSTGTISFGGGTLQYSASNTTDYSNRFSNAANQAYSVDTNGQDVTFGTGLTSSGGTFTKSGAGTLVFRANNTYSGTTTISGGTLQVGDGGITGTLGTGPVVDNATLAFNRSDSVNVSNSISGTGAVNQIGTGTTTLTAANTYSGATTVSLGTLAAGATHALGGTSSVTVASGATLALSGVGGNDRINNSAAINLNGGATFNTGGLTEGVVPTGPTGSGGSAGMGALTLANTSPVSHIVINFAAPGSALAFSSLVGAAGQYVDIFNWTGNLGFDDGNANNDRLLSASDPGLSQTDLANFNFYSDGGSTLFAAGGTEFVYGNMFEIVAVPEPGTWFAAVLTLLAIGFSQRKRLRACASAAAEKHS